MDKSIFSILDIDDIWDISREQNDGKIILIGNEIEQGSIISDVTTENNDTDENEENNDI